MDKYEIYLTGLTVKPKGVPIYHERANILIIQDDAAGPYVNVSQAAPAENGINIAPEEWPKLREAIDQLIATCRTINR